MRPRPTQVAEQLGVGAAGVLQGQVQQPVLALRLLVGRNLLSILPRATPNRFEFLRRRLISSCQPEF